MAGVEIGAVKGNLITADTVNSINGLYTIRFTVPSGADRVQDYIGNSGAFYSHRQYGRPLLSLPSIVCGMFGGGHASLDMWINGGWSQLKSWSWGWYTNEAINEISRGPGYYRFISDDWQMNEITGYIYCSDIDCNKGELIRCTDVWQSNNGGYISGGYITTNLANSGRICQDGH